jgi:hypothetical protein
MVTGEVACEEKKTCYYTLEGGIDNTAYLFECMARHAPSVRDGLHPEQTGNPPGIRRPPEEASEW